jgi:two-component system sensor histidine kinase CpxA
MKLSQPLSVKILVWFGVNLTVLALVFAFVFRDEFRLGLDSLVSGRAGDRIESLVEGLAATLREQPVGEWEAVLARYSEAYDVQFGVYRETNRVAGTGITLPAEVEKWVTLKRWVPERPAVPTAPVPLSSGDALGRPYPKRAIRTTGPTRYWVLVRVPFREPGQRQRWPGTVVVMSPSFRLGGLLFDPTPWLAAGLGGLALSVLLWLPLVRGITRSISGMTRVTGRMAEGRFEVRVPTVRSDELGQLATAINRMAERLEGYVQGQRRFLGDIAHELCSPLARIQLAVDILEPQVASEGRSNLEDLRQDVQMMSGLVNDLLAFSRAGLQGRTARREPVALAEVVRGAIERESGGTGPAIDVHGVEGVQVMADKDLLGRAVGNLVRNAVRYAGTAGPIAVVAVAENNHVRLQVADSGPGVPAEALPGLFTPFYRPDPARSRETGGIGLGLAIVKTCVEACGGTVSCANRQPRGFQVEITLERA